MIVVTTDGRAIQDDRQPSMKTLYEICETDCVEVVPLVHVICDEEATLKGKPINKVASRWLKQSLYGNVVFLTDSEWKIFLKLDYNA
jgi:hypothetical protein